MKYFRLLILLFILDSSVIIGQKTRLYGKCQKGYLACTGLFLLPLLLSIVSNELARKKSIHKAEYFQSTNDLDRKGARKYIKLENGFKLVIGSCYLIGTILLGIIYYSNFCLS